MPFSHIPGRKSPTRAGGPRSLALRTATVLLLAGVWLAIGASAKPPAPPPIASGSITLVRASDFVGFVQVELAKGSRSTERIQVATLPRVEPIKGSLTNAVRLNGSDPVILAENTEDPPRYSRDGDYVAGSALRSNFPNRFSESGEYLVFLRRDNAAGTVRRSSPGGPGEDRVLYSTLAVFPVTPRASSSGAAAVRTVLGPPESAETLSANTVRTLLTRMTAHLARGETVPKETVEPLDRLFRRPDSPFADPKPGAHENARG